MQNFIFMDAVNTTNSINLLDVVVIILIIFSTVRGYMKGLIRSVFDLISTILSVFIASKLYPVVSVLLREKTSLFTNIKQNVIDSMNLNGIIEERSIAAQEAFINSLPLPGFLSDLLRENNNPEVYSILNVSSIEEYIGGYIANIVVNIVAAVLVFVLVFVIMKLITKALDVVSKLPVIHSFNKTGGLISGFLSGIIYVWLLLIVYTVFLSSPENNTMEVLYHSTIALFFYKNNYLLYTIIKIFT